MGNHLLAIGAAIVLGMQTSISPCPLATNIAAISYIGRRVGSPRQVVLAGLLYTLGRTLVYMVLAVVLVAGLLSAPGLSLFLQRHMDRLLGPLLIVVAMFLLDLAPLGVSGMGVSDGMRKRIDVLGIWGAGLLGIVFALAFCPVSAAWFFGTLIPLCVKVRSCVALPIAYGLGTAIPVIVFAVSIGAGARSLGKAFGVMAKIEWWSRRITAAILLAIGVHYTIKYVFEITPFWDPWVQAAAAAYSRIVPNLRGME